MNGNNFQPYGNAPMAMGANGQFLANPYGPSPEEILAQRRQMITNAEKQMNTQMDSAATVNGNGQSGATYMATRESRGSRFNTNTFSQNYQQSIPVEEQTIVQKDVERDLEDRGFRRGPSVESGMPYTGAGANWQGNQDKVSDAPINPDFKDSPIARNFQPSGERQEAGATGYDISSRANVPVEDMDTKLEGALKIGTEQAMKGNETIPYPYAPVKPVEEEVVPKVEEVVEATPPAPPVIEGVKPPADKSNPQPANALDRMVIENSLESPQGKGFWSNMFGSLVQDSQMKKALVLGGLMAYGAKKSGRDLGESLATGLYGAIAQYNHNPDKMAAKKLAFEMSKYIRPENQAKVSELISKGDYAGAKGIISSDWQDYDLVQSGKYIRDEKTGKLVPAGTKLSASDMLAQQRYAFDVAKFNAEQGEKQRLLQKEKLEKVYAAEETLPTAFRQINMANTLAGLDDAQLDDIVNISSPVWNRFGLFKDEVQINNLLDQLRNEALKLNLDLFPGALSQEELKKADKITLDMFGKTPRQRREFFKWFRAQQEAKLRKSGVVDIDRKAAYGNKDRYKVTDPRVGISYQPEIYF